MDILSVGAEYEKEEIEKAAGIRFGFRINGIVVRKIERSSDKRLILLFSRSDDPYPDCISDNAINYIGAGLRGDQPMKGVNKVLSERGKIDGLHFFHQSSGSRKWKYLGHGYVLSSYTDRDNNRQIWRFNIQLETLI